jgi:hypothetical protein
MFQLLNGLDAWCGTWSYELSFFAFGIIIVRMAHRGCNIWKPLVHEHDDQVGLHGTINRAHQLSTEISYLAIIKSWCKSIAKVDLRNWLWKAHIVPTNGKNQPLAAIHIQPLPAKNTSRHYWEIYPPTINNYFLISLTWIHLIWVCGIQHISSMHTRRSSPLWAI